MHSGFALAEVFPCTACNGQGPLKRCPRVCVSVASCARLVSRSCWPIHVAQLQRPPHGASLTGPPRSVQGCTKGGAASIKGRGGTRRLRTLPKKKSHMELWRLHLSEDDTEAQRSEGQAQNASPDWKPDTALPSALSSEDPGTPWSPALPPPAVHVTGVHCTPAVRQALSAVRAAGRLSGQSLSPWRARSPEGNKWQSGAVTP